MNKKCGLICDFKNCNSLSFTTALSWSTSPCLPNASQANLKPDKMVITGRTSSKENFKKWIGGYYEAGWSTNPHWVCDSILNKDHPISKSVKKFSVNDEWYFNMRWADTPFHTDILQGIPNKETRTTGRSRKLTHIHKALGKKETLLWAVERKDGGRGFGFTGGHNHANWKHDEFRKLVLNAIVWLAKVEVPENGVETVTPTDAEMHHLTKLDRGTGPKVKKD